jgi:exosortase/archaeosortase family protein
VDILKNKHLKLVLIGVAIFAILQFAPAADILSSLARPVISAILAIAGFPVVNQGETFRIGSSLIIPWSRDCAGVNSLTLLVVFLLWNWRKQSWNATFWVQAALLVPLALVANVARVLTIIVWRGVFFPAVEGLQLHYLISFLWLLPAIALLSPPVANKRFSWPSIEIFYFGIVLAWISPLMGIPGGMLVALTTLWFLIQSRSIRKVPAWLIAGWMSLALGIAIMAMDSLWLPWMLICPWFCPIKGQTARFLLLPATVTVFAVNPWLQGFTALVLIWELRKLAIKNQEPDVKTSGSIPPIIPGLLCLPFLIGDISRPEPGLKSHVFPTGVRITPISDSSWVLNMNDTTMGAYWFDAQGGGRHHTLSVCMRYRGTTLTPAPGQAEVWTDAEHRFWLREFFLVGGNFYSYRGYLKQTFYPFAPIGAHLIVFAPKSGISSSDFAKQSLGFPRKLLPVCGDN